MTGAPSRAGAFAASTIVLGLGVVVAGAFAATAEATLTMLAVFAAAMVLTELIQVPDVDGVVGGDHGQSLSFSSSVQMAAVMVFGPLPAAMVATLGVLIVDPLRGSPPRKVAFNASVFALSTFFGGIAYVALGGTVGRTSLPHDVPAILGLAAVYSTLNILFVNAIVALSSARSLRVELLDLRRGELSLRAAEAALAATMSFFVLSNPWKALFLVPLVYAVYQAQARLALLRAETSRALETFANVVDERDPYTFRHSDRVANHVQRLAQALGFPASYVGRLRWAGRLHDLGKIAVDRSVLSKAGELDDEEWAAIIRHPRLSARLLRRFDFAADEARAVEYHHERFDGSGYYGIPAAEQPLAAHLLVVADSFDAMTTDRPYRDALPREVALAEIERQAGAQFHPAVAKAFVALEKGLDPRAVLSAGERDELRRLARRRPGHLVAIQQFLDVAPEAAVIGGIVGALVVLATAPPVFALIPASLAVAGIVVRMVDRGHTRRLVSNMRVILAAPVSRAAVFDAFTRKLAEIVELRWSALIGWQEDELFGWIELERRLTSERPRAAALTSWLIRDADAGERVLRASGSEVGGAGVYLAIALQPSGVTQGFLVLGLGARPPRRLSPALEACAEELETAFTGAKPAKTDEPEQFPPSLAAAS
ncbi:MAG TPA: HD domain-containing phosphohydrolase [Gaiellaceae bacterium]|nr:HD domain-containing phosphohydrolase [Gaiellaceae bacterium]